MNQNLMKRQSGCVLIALLCGLFLFSCGQQSATNESNEQSSKKMELQYYDKIVGTWLVVETQESDGSVMSLEMKEMFYETGAYKSTGTIKITTSGVTLTYTMALNGKYRIKGSVLSYDYDIKSFSLKPQTNPKPSSTQKYMYENMTDHLAAGLKKSMINDDTSEEIVEFTKTSMVYKTPEGERKTRKRVK